MLVPAVARRDPESTVRRRRGAGRAAPGHRVGRPAVALWNRSCSTICATAPTTAPAALPILASARLREVLEHLPDGLAARSARVGRWYRAARASAPGSAARSRQSGAAGDPRRAVSRARPADPARAARDRPRVVAERDPALGHPRYRRDRSLPARAGDRRWQDRRGRRGRPSLAATPIALRARSAATARCTRDGRAASGAGIWVERGKIRERTPDRDSRAELAGLAEHCDRRGGGRPGADRRARRGSATQPAAALPPATRPAELDRWLVATGEQLGGRSSGSAAATARSTRRRPHAPGGSSRCRRPARREPRAAPPRRAVPRSRWCGAADRERGDRARCPGPQ